MMTSAEMNPDIEAGRRIAFTIAKAEASLGLTQTALPADDRLHAILSEAAMRPGELDPQTYGLIYLLLTKSSEPPQ
jgi:hypothetical protein